MEVLEINVDVVSSKALLSLQRPSSGIAVDMALKSYGLISPFGLVAYGLYSMRLQQDLSLNLLLNTLSLHE